MPRDPESGRLLRSMSARGRREAHWRDVLGRASRSGLRPTAFCRSQGITPANFFWWKTEIARRDHASSSLHGKHQAPRARLVPVRLVEREEGEHKRSLIEVVLAGGRVLRVAPRFDVETLRRLVAALEELC